MSIDLYDNEDEDAKYEQNGGLSDEEKQQQSIVDLQAQLYSPQAERIADNKWRQLRCKTQTLTYNVTWVRCIYMVIAVICIPIGVITYSLSQSVVIQEFEPYNHVANCSMIDAHGNDTYGTTCVVNYTLDYDFDPPIYFHYKLTNVYQNHRSYVKSRSEVQLQNKNPLYEGSECSPNSVQYSEADSTDKLIMLPCGLIANSFFNDKFKVTYIEQDESAVKFCNATRCDDNERSGAGWSAATWHARPNWEYMDIAWKSDVEGKFADTQQVDGRTTNVNKLQKKQGLTLPGTDDQDFIVWMRTATTSTFTKLHRIIRGQPLKKGGVLQVTIKNYFVVNEFDGEKSIVITTNSSIGGKNDVLGITYMVVGGISLLTALCFRMLIPPQSSSIRPVQNELENAAVIDYRNQNMKA